MRPYFVQNCVSLLQCFLVWFAVLILEFFVLVLVPFSTLFTSQSEPKCAKNGSRKKFHKKLTLCHTKDQCSKEKIRIKKF